jgi:hypothetical protein
MRLGRGLYWLIGYLFSVAVTYAGTQYARSRGGVAPIVPGAAALVVGAVLCGIGIVLARRFGRQWEGVLVGGLGVLGVALGLANLLR